MGWSNIFCQIITPAGPIIGEGLLSGWQTSIELDGFEWTAQIGEATGKASTGATSFMDKAKKALETAVPGVRDGAPFQPTDLKISKRFDIASSDLHLLMDNPEMPIISVSITVLHIAHGGQYVHRPGFVILCTDCKIKEVDVKMEPSENGVQIKEDVTIGYESITITYMRSLGDEVVPTIPFLYIRNKPRPSLF